MKLFGFSLALFACLSFTCGLNAQNAGQDEDAKQLREAIDQQVKTYTDLLDLEYWQVFYVDSIMTHDYGAMTAELKELQESKVTNSSVYEMIQDKWAEQMYNAYRKVFNDEQWQKYLRAGAARDKKARDKREARRAQ